MFILSVTAIIYPLFNHNLLLSSRAEFRFSIQIGSIGPSLTIHFLV